MYVFEEYDTLSIGYKKNPRSRWFYYDIDEDAEHQKFLSMLYLECLPKMIGLKTLVVYSKHSESFSAPDPVEYENLDMDMLVLSGSVARDAFPGLDQRTKQVLVELEDDDQDIDEKINDLIRKT